ncbi:CLUMA_CG004418, isoform C [Clunio marinus]|uniref:CLUMA_CG004418, isoform C n=1 Tax=Clunio marinus TaxID=568069 RepID=A0A1J1HRS7_9DIPT|nr:CLUMA_CG004418, isoform C [Clunio marinus]
MLFARKTNNKCDTTAAALIFIEFFVDNVKRGFFCGDKSISFKRQTDTISIKIVILYGLIPILVLWIVEFIFIGELDESQRSLKHKLKLSWRKAVHWFKDYGINLVLKLLVLDASKVLVGGHRPHFIDTCRPDTAINCTIGEFVADFKCTNEEVSLYSLRDSSRSFPSGHASISVYTSLFLIWYLQCRIPKLQSIFLLPFIQCLLMVWTCLCSISRITDNRHHWYDVLCGGLLGVIFAFYTCHILSNNFCKDKHRMTMSGVNGSSSSSSNNNRRSVRRLLSTISAKEEFTLNNLE